MLGQAKTAGALPHINCGKDCEQAHPQQAISLIFKGIFALSKKLAKACFRPFSRAKTGLSTGLMPNAT